MVEAKINNCFIDTNKSLKEQDPDIYNLIKDEEKRQYRGLELIASENFTSKAVLDTLGTCLTNKYSEGLPGKRYYGGTEIIDKIEKLTQKRALQAFGVEEKGDWGVNVQPYSGSTANFAAYVGIIKPNDRIMGLDLPSGGHLTHGYYTNKKKISATSMFFQSFPYKLDKDTGYINYDELEENAKVFLPQLIICGASAYPRDWDYERLSKIAKSVNALLLCDMAHFSGLVASKLLNNPFDYCDVVTTTTHKSLRGPRAGLIFYRKELGPGVNFAVFPSVQGGPHNNTIAAVAVQLKEVMTPEFKKYSQQVISNSKTLAKTLMDKGYVLVTGGTDNHLILWDLRPTKINGGRMQYACDAVSITLNKNSIFGDRSAITPGGVRIGTPALTSRGFKEKDFVVVGDFLDKLIKILLPIQKEIGTKKGSLKKFKDAIDASEDLKKLRKEVEEFATQFIIPGFQDQL